MPSVRFFQNLGLYARQGFFGSSACARILDEMRKAEFEKGLVTRKDSEDELLDESRRRVLVANVPRPTEQMVGNSLLELKPDLEQHFGVQLKGSQELFFLRYGEGAFYKPHTDASSDSPAHVIKRTVSIVIFLNAPASGNGGYTGGALTFYGLLPGPQWENCALSLDAEPGLLIAFRSCVVHEVLPIASGQRFTIVSWFLSS